MARGEVAAAALDERRLLDRADIGGVRTPRVEATAARRVDRARDVAAQHDPLSGPLDDRVGNRHCREQRLGVRMMWASKHCVGRPDFHQPSDIKHCDAIRYVAHHV